MKIISLIPARGGSKGIYKKNIKRLLGRPLINYSINDALDSELIDNVYLSTEDQEIEEIASEYGVIVIKRPFELATDTASTESVMLHSASEVNWDFDYMVLLQPTSPFRTSKVIDSAIRKIIVEKGDSLLSVYQNDKFLWNKKAKPINYDYLKRPRRQDKKWEYVENGSIYITSKSILKKSKNRLGGKIILFKMPFYMSFEIDTPLDWEYAEFIMKKYKPIYFRKINKIKLIIFDFDGVFTDGGVYVNESGRETLKFSRIDGKGLELLRKNGIQIAIISSEMSKAALSRIEKLEIPKNQIFLGQKNKITAFKELKKKFQYENKNIAFLGDDIQDIEIMKECGFSAAPKNAIVDVKKIASYISPFKRGEGFIRDVTNIVLKNNGDLSNI